MTHRRIVATISGCALLATSSFVVAQPSSKATSDSASVQPADLAAILNDSDLDGLRGGDALVVSNQTLTALTTGNVINGDYTAGDVTVSDSAFSSFTGMGNVLINTGAQVSLQTGLNVTINVSP